MFNKYTIDLSPPGHTVVYKCHPQSSVAYSAKFLACECGCVFTEPIVSLNGNIKIIILVEGLRNTDNLVSVVDTIGDKDLSHLASVISEHHNIPRASIEHSLNRAKVIIKERHGRDIDLSGCTGETLIA